VQIIVAVNAGARGAIAWDDPTTPGIKAGASQICQRAPRAHTLPAFFTAVFAARPICARRYARSAGLRPVGFLGGKGAGHGRQLELLSRQHRARRGALCHTIHGFEPRKPSSGSGWGRQDCGHAGHVFWERAIRRVDIRVLILSSWWTILLRTPTRRLYPFVGSCN
jgi:hypothetical protein